MPDLPVPSLSATNPPYHHTPKGFRNPPGSPRRGGTRAEFFRFLLRMQQRRQQALPPAHIVPSDAALDGFAAAVAAGPDAVTWLGHAAFLLRLGGLRSLLDPWLAPRASPLPFWGPKRYAPPGIPVPRLPPIDLVAVSHSHYDHLDLASLRALAKNP